MYTVHSDAERQEMFQALGIKKIDELFDAVPKDHLYPFLNLPQRQSEQETMQDLSEFASGNDSAANLVSFLGAGSYHHYIPAVVPAIISRGEFLTAYTPYQPEVSQGTLQAIFEYQSLITRLTGMDVSNASHYDGATAVAEAVNMADAVHRGKRSRVVLSPALHPHYRETVNTYNNHGEYEIVGEDLDPFGTPEQLEALIDDNTAVVVVQYPDFFGRIFDYTKLAEKAHAHKALLTVSVNPLALGILKPPSEFGADIVAGEGQPLGIPMNFGGPYLGILATKKKYVRNLAGRLVGETTDSRGQRGYVLTLSTREQHIKRERASSNICSNQGLMALSAAVYMTLLGKEGFTNLAKLNFNRAHFAAQEINQLDGFEVIETAPFLNEFVVKTPISAAEFNEKLLEKEILAGVDLGAFYNGMENYLMLAVTEMNSRTQIEYLIDMLKEVVNG